MFDRLDSTVSFSQFATMADTIKDSKTEATVQTVSQVDIDEVKHADDARLAELGYKSEFRREFSVSMFDDVKSPGCLMISGTIAFGNHSILVLYHGCYRFRLFHA